MYLLSNQNTKMLKSEKKGYFSSILHLHPYKMPDFIKSNKNVCPYSTTGCRVCCLNTAGRGQFTMTQNARIVRTLSFWENKKAFVRQVKKEIRSAIKKAAAKGLKLSVRLNGTSDLAWEKIDKTIFSDFPKVKFYDYTKNPNRFTKDLPANYHLTFSLSEKNEAEARRLLRKGVNVAVVFRKKIPRKFWNKSVVNGDTHDLRFLDKKGRVVGLTAKGKASKDETGFVKDIAV